jgi:UDP-MurNAc hydroxylase
MKICFVGHANILVESQNQRILCDPWLVGKVFNNGWALVSPPNPPSFSTVDYTWISHEHPDHFNFPSLKSVPTLIKLASRCSINGTLPHESSMLF